MNWQVIIGHYLYRLYKNEALSETPLLHQLIHHYLRLFCLFSQPKGIGVFYEHCIDRQFPISDVNILGRFPHFIRQSFFHPQV